MKRQKVVEIFNVEFSEKSAQKLVGRFVFQALPKTALGLARMIVVMIALSRSGHIVEDKRLVDRFD